MTEPNGLHRVPSTPLLGCPFCGKRPSISTGKRWMKDSQTHTYKRGDWMWTPSVGCRPCGILFKGDDLAAIVSRWNTRKPNAEAQRSPASGDKLPPLVGREIKP